MYVQPMGRDVIFLSVSQRLYPREQYGYECYHGDSRGNTCPDSGCHSGAYPGAGICRDPCPHGIPHSGAHPGAGICRDPCPYGISHGSPEAAETPEPASTPEAQGEELQNTITEEAAPVSDSGGEESLNASQGLSLSTRRKQRRKKPALPGCPDPGSRSIPSP